MTRYNRRTTRSCHLDSIEKGATAIINGDDPPTRRRRTGDAGGDAQSPLPAQLCRLPLFLACAFHRGDGDDRDGRGDRLSRSEEHTSELQSLMRISYAVFCLKKKKNQKVKQLKILNKTMSTKEYNI